MQVIAILLAAGSSTRFKSDKLSAPYKGRALFQHSLDALRSSARIGAVIMVVNPHFPSKETVGCDRITRVVNPDYAEGMGSSLRAGVMAAPEDADAYLIALADMPEVTAELVDSLVDFAERTSRQIIVPLHGGQRGHPVVIKRDLRDALLQIKGDVGARAIIRDNPEMVRYFETDDPGVVFDVDSPEDLEAPKASSVPK